MNIDLIAFDLDGTTLDRNREISPANKKALKNARDAGVLLVPCTGRSPANLSDALIALFNEMGFASFPYIITDNGAQAYALPARELLLTKNIDEKTSLAILEKGRTYRAIIHCSLGPEGGTDSKGAVWKDGTGQRMIVSYEEKWYIPVTDMEPLIRWNGGALKFSMNFCDHDEFISAQKEFSLWSGISLTSGNEQSFEIMTRGIHKGETLDFVARRAGIPMERVMAIGDNYNDMEMIRNAGWGVAMGNAVPELKENADWVTAGNNEDGLAVAIQKMLSPP